MRLYSKKNLKTTLFFKKKSKIVGFFIKNLKKKWTRISSKKFIASTKLNLNYLLITHKQIRPLKYLKTLL
jgi:hypothetical protein